MLKAFIATTHDMAILLDDELSENQGVTPEGYLICKNVPVSRVGVQYYLGSELGLQDAWNKRIPVYRLAEDVFHEESLRSLESKPITDDHPQNPVTVQNASYLAMGHGRNVRFSDKHVMADLVITNAGLIQAVRDKRKFEISLGYTCKYMPYKDGYKQTDIRINHIAVVENGRAGRKVCIKDKALIENNRRSRKMPMTKQQAFAELLQAYAKDASTEQVEAVLPFLTDAEPAKPTESDKTDKGLLALVAGLLSRDSKPVEPKVDKTEALTADAVEKIVQDALAKALKPKPKATKDESEKELKAMIEDEDPDKDDEEKEAKDKDDEEGGWSEDESEEEKEAKDADFAAIVAAIKPAYQKLPKAEQKSMRDSLAAIRKKPTADAYAKILGIVQANRKTHDAQTAIVRDSSDLARNVMASRNPHYKKKA